MWIVQFPCSQTNLSGIAQWQLSIKEEDLLRNHVILTQLLFKVEFHFKIHTEHNISFNQIGTAE